MTDNQEEVRGPAEALGEPREFRVFGPPGTGKTEFIKRQIEAACAKYDPYEIMAASFTTAAASELASRVALPRENVGTLHALCYRALGRPKLTENYIKDWNSSHPIYALNGTDDNEVSAVGRGHGDSLNNQAQILRAKMIPVELWPVAVQHFYAQWEAWKAEHGYIDFTDMIALAYRDVDCAPGEPRVGFLDEVQDLSPLELALVRKWGRAMDYFIICGDDDQAQPEGSRVLIEGGKWVNIEHLDPAVHRLVSYDARTSRLNGLRQGHAFQVRSHAHAGALATIQIGAHQMRCTPEHKLLVRWSEEARNPDIHVVYLMRKGSWWRIGWCRLMRSDGCLHVGVRAHGEKADALWILRVCSSRAEASQWESIISSRYGIPLVMFRSQSVRQTSGHYTTEVIRSIFLALEDVLPERASACLRAHGLAMESPFWANGGSSRCGRQLFVVTAVNVLAGLMRVPVLEEIHTHGLSWECIDRVLWEPYHGPVYSIGVEPHRTYVTDDGIVSHNCIFSFKGASPDAFLRPEIAPEFKRVLSQSYRVPRVVQEFSQRWIKQLRQREPKEYRPRDEEGKLTRLPRLNWKQPEGLLDTLGPLLAQGKSVMLLATCAYMLSPVIQVLRQNGTPYFNPFTRSHGEWNPLHPSRGLSVVQRLLAFLRPDGHVYGDMARMWTGEDLYAWATMLKQKGVFLQARKDGDVDLAGGKQVLETLHTGVEECSVEALMQVFEENALARLLDLDVQWLADNALAERRKSMDFPLRVIKAQGAKALRDDPQAITGTVHSVKGGQADVVVLFPDLSSAGMQAWMQKGEGHDAIVRLMYVGMTRAREQLILCGQASPLAVQL